MGTAAATPLRVWSSLARCAAVGATLFVVACGSTAPIDKRTPSGSSTGSGGSSSSNSGPDGLPLVPAGTGTGEGVQPGSQLLAAEAARELAAMRSTSYSHEVDVDEATGAFDYDCSGFVDYALIRVLPSHYREFTAATEDRPLAQDFVTYFTGDSTSLPADWVRVTRVVDLVPGDILSWLAVPDDFGDTGHVMIVRNAPVADPSHAGAYDVDIWDSTPDVHGEDDSRAGRSGGLGTGTVVLYVDGTGAPSNHSWSPDATAVDTTTVALGRAL